MDDPEIMMLPPIANKVLSSAAMDALQEFYKERDRTAEKFLKLKTWAEEEEETRKRKGDGGDGERLTDAVGEGEDGKGKAGDYDADGNMWSMDLFTEDWNVSQFWYSQETANTYARHLLAGTTSDSVIVALSTPSVFLQLKNMLATVPVASRPRVVLLEHDARFEVFGKEFVWYDFNYPLKVPAELKGRADRIILDPPFLGEECQTKSALTVRLLARKSPSSSSSSFSTPPSSTTATATTTTTTTTATSVPSTSSTPTPGSTSLSSSSSSSASPPSIASSTTAASSVSSSTGQEGGGDQGVGEKGGDAETKIIISTGERMEALVTSKLYTPLGVRTTDYDVVHARGLSNEFRCYSNFECEDWSWDKP